MKFEITFGDDYLKLPHGFMQNVCGETQLIVTLC